MRGVWLLVGLGYAVALRASSHPFVAALTLVTHLLFAVPGILIVRLIAGRAPGWMPALTFGPLLGHAFGSIVLLGLWSTGARGGWLLVAAPALACLPAMLARRMSERWRFAHNQPGEGFWLLLLLLVVPLVVALPFSRVGAHVAEGQVYRAYFTADYVWRRAVVLELAKGDFLPVNPFYRGDALHYYWLPHLQTAIEYEAFGHVSADLNDLLLVRSVLVDAMFVALLYGMARQFVGKPWAAAAAVTCSLLFTSFEGLYGVWDHWWAGAPLHLLRHYNIDAISRWIFGGMPIDGLHRLLWYQPHHALGYGTGILGLLAITRRLRRFDPHALASGGALLGLSTLISSFGGLMLTAAAALDEAVSVLRWREWRRAIAHLAAASIPLGLAAVAVTLLEYVDRGGQVISFGVNPVATHNLLPATLLSFGPILALGGAGAWVAWRSRRLDLGPFAALVAISVVFYFLVDIRDHQNVYVGWRVGHMTFMASAVVLGLLFEQLALARWRALGWAMVTAIIAAAAPTLIIDVYNTQDIWNRAATSGFHWTLLITHDELEAFDWIQHHTRRDAVMQVDPIARDSNTWAYLPAFGDRRMAVGLPISMVPLHKYQVDSRRIREIYSSTPVTAHERALRAGVQYVVVGPPERAAHPGVEERFDSVPTLLALVFRNPTISIYAVSITARSPGRPRPQESSRRP